MRSADDPSSLSRDERLAELAGIFAADVLRLRHQVLPDVPTTPEACSASDGKTSPSTLEVVSETVLSVRVSERFRSLETPEMNVKKEVAALERLTVNDLREKYAEVYGEQTNGRHKHWLVRRIVWRMQALEEGDLSERARRRAREIANDADVRVIAPKAKPAPEPIVSGDRVPIPGSTIVRRYKGRQLEVRVLDGGFEFEGERFGTLSSVAKHITGSHCSGYRFFGLSQEKGK